MKNIYKISIVFIISLFFSRPIFAAPYINLKLSYDGKLHNYNKEIVYLYVNGKKVENLPMQPIIFNDSTLVPAREVFELLGAQVLWNKENSQIDIIYEGNNIKMQLDNNKATVNGVEYIMPIPPKLINAKTMIPTRFVSESIGLNVIWDGKKRIVNISNTNNTSSAENNTQSTSESTSQSTSQNTTQQTNFGNIEFIEMPNSDENTFYISANKKIENFKMDKLDDKTYVLDIFDFKTSVKEPFFDGYSKYVTKLSIEQKENFVRILFTLNEPAKYETFFEEDGKVLCVTFGGNYIKRIEKSKNLENENNDILKIYTDNEIKYTIEKISDKIIINIKDGNPEFLIQDFKDTNFINEVTYSREIEDLFKIEVCLNSNVNFKDKKENNILTLEIGESFNNSTINTQQNISGNEFIIDKNTNLTINLNSIVHQDDYYNNRYILKFPTDITSLIKEGEYTLQNKLIKNVVVKNVNSKTEITLNTNQIIAVNVLEDDSKIYIKPILPKEKYKNIVVIDPGHGGHDGGTSGFGLYEKNIVLDIGNRLVNLINQDSDIKIYSSRITDMYPSFDDRTNLGNEVGDMFVSIHVNAPSVSTNTKPNGTEIHYLNPNTSSSGLTSNIMANIFQKNLLNDIGTKDRGLKKTNFKVLRDSKIPAILCELAFITNPEDNKKLASEVYRQKFAESLYKSIKEIFNKYPSKR